MATETKTKRRKGDDDRDLLLLLLLASPYRWDTSALKYVLPSGKFVSQQAVKQAINTYVRKTQREVQRYAREVAAGKLDVAEWQVKTATAIKSSQLAASAAAQGGWAQMDQQAFARVGESLRFHYRKLRKFAERIIRAVDIPVEGLTPKQIEARADMYGAASRVEYEAARRALHRKNGFKFEKNTLGKSEHCGLCLKETARGWVKIGELVPIGERTCLTRCHCWYTFKR